jgi:hypothetical protein
VIADDEMEMAPGQIMDQLAQPVHCGGECLALISECTPTEIENITIQDDYLGVTQFFTDSTESHCTARSAGK